MMHLGIKDQLAAVQCVDYWTRKERTEPASPPPWVDTKPLTSGLLSGTKDQSPSRSSSAFLDLCLRCLPTRLDPQPNPKSRGPVGGRYVYEVEKLEVINDHNNVDGTANYISGHCYTREDIRTIQRHFYSRHPHLAPVDASKDELTALRSMWKRSK